MRQHVVACEPCTAKKTQSENNEQEVHRDGPSLLSLRSQPLKSIANQKGYVALVSMARRASRPRQFVVSFGQHPSCCENIVNKWSLSLNITGTSSNWRNKELRRFVDFKSK